MKFKIKINGEDIIFDDEDEDDDGDLYDEDFEKEEKKKKKIVRPEKGESILKLADSYTVIDIETTGLSPTFDKIIELSALKVENGAPVGEFSELVNPEIPVSAFITSLTGITNDMLKDRPKIEDVLPRFLDFLGNSLIVGHNANFDINFIYDNAESVLRTAFSNDFVDTMRLGRRLIDGLEHYRLQDLAEYFKIDYSHAHRALEDCKITQTCYEQLKKIVAENPEKAEKLTYTRHYYTARAKSIHTDNTTFNEDHPLYGKVCVITGELSIPRKKAMQAIADVGGINADGITKKTNYLIVGSYDYSNYGQEYKSTKMKKAEEYKLNGQDIEIISEDVFLTMLSEFENAEEET